MLISISRAWGTFFRWWWATGGTSKDLDTLYIIKAIAESRVLCLSRETGQPIANIWMGQVIWQLRKSLRTAFVWAQAACLTSRIGHLGQTLAMHGARGELL